MSFAFMTSRLLTVEDGAVLAALDALCFGAEAWSEAQIRGSLALPSTLAEGWEEEGQLFAFYFLQRMGDDEAEILTLGVHPERRRRGWGLQLLERIKARQGRGRLFLDVAVDNVSARALYEKAGFTLFGVRTAYYRRAEGAVDALNYLCVL